MPRNRECHRIEGAGMTKKKPRKATLADIEAVVHDMQAVVSGLLARVESLERRPISPPPVPKGQTVWWKAWR
jgi:hypothetical protein